MATKTGLKKLDDALGGGLQDGTLTVLGSDTGVGKTRLVAYFAAQSLAAGRNVVVVSTEGTARDFPACVKAAFFKQPSHRYEQEAPAEVIDFNGAKLRQSHQICPDSEQVETFLQGAIDDATGLVILDRLANITNDGVPLSIDDDVLSAWLERVKKLLVERRVPCVATTFPEDSPSLLESRDGDDPRQRSFARAIDEMAEAILLLIAEKDAIDANLRTVLVRRRGQKPEEVELKADLSRAMFEEI